MHRSTQIPASFPALPLSSFALLNFTCSVSFTIFSSCLQFLPQFPAPSCNLLRWSLTCALIPSCFLTFGCHLLLRYFDFLKSFLSLLFVYSISHSRWGFWTLYMVWHSRNYKTQRSLRLALYKGPIRVDISTHHLRMGTGPVSETLGSLFLECQMMDRARKPSGSHCYTHHCQNPSESPYSISSYIRLIADNLGHRKVPIRL